jgi:hypothetical protein
MDVPLARICFAAAFACSSLAQTQNQTPTIRVNVDLVSVNVRVTDKQNRDVPQLSADDFDLLEDGRKQKIAFFDTNKEPITLSILVDSSSSMSNGGMLDAAQIMLRELMNSLRPEDDVSLMQFTDRIVSFKKVTWELWPLHSPPVPPRSREALLSTTPWRQHCAVFERRRIYGKPLSCLPTAPISTAGSSWNN